MRGLDWQTLQVPLAAGLSSKADVRAMQSPGLLICRDAQFDEIGGLQTRHPFAALSTAILGGGTITAPRKLFAFGDELLLFTVDKLYGWSPAQNTWIEKGTHLAIKTEESSRFVTTGDQAAPDRAELSGIVFYVWSDAAGSYVAAMSSSTGAITLAPVNLGANATRPRLVALATKILLLYRDTPSGVSKIQCVSLDPLAPATSLLATPLSVAIVDVGLYYDAVKVPNADEAVVVSTTVATTSIKISVVTATPTTRTSVTPALVCDGPIAVAVSPTASHVQLVRASTTNLLGDIYTLGVSLGTVATGLAVGTAAGTINQIAIAHRSVQDSGVYRCYAFWSSAEISSAVDWQSKTNWFASDSTLGTQATFVRRLGIGSRAFDRNGRVFVWGVFAGESSFSGANYTGFRAVLQNTYLLFRDDATLHGKAAAGRAGGFVTDRGSLPGVATADGIAYAFAGVERRIIAVGDSVPKTTGNGRNVQTSYGARAPRDITFAFDHNDARRCARLGNTLYIAGAEVLQYDGVQLAEVGFAIYPWYFGAIEVGAGNLEDGTYAYQVTWRWDNATGEMDRSSTATTGTVTIAAGPNGVNIPSWMPLYTTRKSNVIVEVWRTTKNPTDDAPFYLTTSKDPAALTNPNRFILNTPTVTGLPSYNDEINDSTLLQRELSPQNGGLLENLAPPSASIIIATADRIILGDVAGDPDRIWYSKLRQDGNVAAFHDALTVSVPRAGGRITGLAILSETLVVFRESAIYALPGDGYDNGSGGQNYGPARLISSDVGAVNHESIALFDRGLIFKSAKGWFLLNKGWNVEYAGGAVAAFDSEPVTSVVVVDSQHQIRCLTSSRMLVFDTLVNQWGEWTISGGVDSATWQGVHAYANATTVLTQRTDFSGIDYGLDVETGWIKLNDLQGFGRCRWLALLGEYRSAHRIRIRVARDYQQNYVDDKYWTANPNVVGDPLQFRHGPSDQRCQSIKVRLTARHETNDAPPAGEALKLTGLALELGFYPGAYRRLPAVQKT